MKINLKSMTLGITFIVFAATCITTAPTFAASNNCRSNVYRYDATGYCVKELQALLRGPFGHNYYQNPYTTNLAIDGGYGPLTRSAVIKFQQNYGGLAVDGIVGPHTWYGLCAPVALNTAVPSASWNAAYNATCL